LRRGGNVKKRVQGKKRKFRRKGGRENDVVKVHDLTKKKGKSWHPGDNLRQKKGKHTNFVLGKNGEPENQRSEHENRKLEKKKCSRREKSQSKSLLRRKTHNPHQTTP